MMEVVTNRFQIGGIAVYSVAGLVVIRSCYAQVCASKQQGPCFSCSLLPVPCLHRTMLWKSCDFSRLAKSESLAAKWIDSLPELEVTSVSDMAAFSTSSPVMRR